MIGCFSVRKLTNLRPTPSKRNILENVNASWYTQKDDEYCRGLHYFYNLHLEYYNETGQDWFSDMTDTVCKYASIVCNARGQIKDRNS